MADPYEVIIVGAGPVGLSCGIQLGRAGIRTLLIERRPTLSRHPKAFGIHSRTMEIFRQWGVTEPVRAAGVPPERSLGFGWMTRMTGFELGNIMLADDAERLAEFAQQCPEPPCFASQNAVEPILLEAAKAFPSFEARFATEATALVSDDTGVTLTVTTNDGDAQAVRARYVIAADGARSPIRNLCGITETAGVPYGESINVYFRAPGIERYTGGRPYLLWWIINRDTQGAFWPAGSDDRWIYNFGGPPDVEYTAEMCADLVRKGAGADDLDVEVLSTLRWQHEDAVADAWRADRVFLIGDAAHRFPPHGGFGMNSGIQDTTNLAWKLIAALRWNAGDELLETYEPERKPVAELNLEQSVLNTQKMLETGWLTPGSPDVEKIETPEGEEFRRQISEAIPKQRDQFWSQGQQFGYVYESAAVVSDGSKPEQSSIAEYRESGAPGARAPHLWLENGGLSSTIDFFGDRFVLLAGAAGAAWIEAAAAVAASLEIPIDGYVIGAEFTTKDRSFEDVYGVEPSGAVLVRPDGHVGYRAPSGVDDPAAELASALDCILGRGNRAAG